jgi:peptide/nickel transport system substrate-binding protein
MASMMLMHEGIAQTAPAPVYKPTKRGGGGPLKVLFWQGATLLQPHFANGTKDQEGSRIFYEPLADLGQRRQPRADPRRRDPRRRRTAACSRAARSVRWRLKKGVTWHDGKPFTADDVVFTWEYARDRRPPR